MTEPISARANFIAAIVFLCIYSGTLGAAVALAIALQNPLTLIPGLVILTGAPHCVDVLMHGKRDAADRG